VVWVFVRLVRAVFFVDKDTKDTVLAGLTVSFVSLAADRSHDAGARPDLWGSLATFGAQRATLFSDQKFLRTRSFWAMRHLED
jgi:hypothetical protein